RSSAVAGAGSCRWGGAVNPYQGGGAAPSALADREHRLARLGRAARSAREARLGGRVGSRALGDGRSRTPGGCTEGRDRPTRRGCGQPRNGLPAARGVGKTETPAPEARALRVPGCRSPIASTTRYELRTGRWDAGWDEDDAGHQLHRKEDCRDDAQVTHHQGRDRQAAAALGVVAGFDQADVAADDRGEGEDAPTSSYRAEWAP